jgi:membrane protease YdiL (CAAX protease family)
MKTGTASGLQIAFFTFAVLLLVVPITGWLSQGLPGASEERVLLRKALPLIIAAAILFGLPRLRRLCRDLLRQAVPGEARLEVAIVAGAKLFLPMALVSGYALWYWTHGGEADLSRYVRTWRSEEAELARAFNPAHLVTTFAVAGFLAPLLEELVFRGLLYKAWEKRLGWAGSMILVSIVFGLYHPLFWSAFASSIVFACLYRRTGSLWAPIIVHAIVNISLWYPLLGRHVLPRSPEAAADLSQWGLHLAALLIAAIALPWYVWLARHKREPVSLPTPISSAHGALPQ